ncbi:MAG: hypothetical protein C5B49_06495 [Bdellovibrio sp.]|nr:MAG: hypothetical protein C5B49_06495 [Bdellovibrio sp.]
MIRQKLDIFCFGETMVEFYRHPDAEDFHTSFGGDTFTTAAMAARMGASSGYGTLLGEDIFTDFLFNRMSATGVDLGGCKKVPGANGIYFITVDAKGERSFQYYRSGSAASRLASQDFTDADLAASRLIYTSGITSALSGSSAALVTSMLTRARAKQRLTAYDLNFRARLWSADDCISHFRGLIDQVKILFLSEDDIPILTASLGQGSAAGNHQISQASIANLIQHCWSRGLAEVIVRLGPRCAWVGDKTSGQIFHQASLPVQAVDTTGAGDTFNGTYLACRIKHQRSVQDSARWAAAAAALQVTRSGSVAGLPTLKEVEEAYRLLQPHP